MIDRETLEAMRRSRRLNLNGAPFTVDMMDPFLDVLRSEGSCTIENCGGCQSAMEMGATLARFAEVHAPVPVEKETA